MLFSKDLFSIRICDLDTASKQAECKNVRRLSLSWSCKGKSGPEREYLPKCVVHAFLPHPCPAIFKLCLKSGLFLLWENISHYRNPGLCIRISRLQKEFWSEDLEASEASQDTWGFQGSIPCRLLLWSTRPDSHSFQSLYLSQYGTVRKKRSFPSNFTSTKWFRKTDYPWGFTKMGEGNIVALWRTNGKWSRKDFNGTWVGTS